MASAGRRGETTTQKPPPAPHPVSPSRKTDELEHARAKALQLEKTTRWWSDCTASWREKWAKAKAENDKATEEIGRLKDRLDAAWKEVAVLRRREQHLVQENEQLRARLRRRSDDVDDDELSRGRLATGLLTSATSGTRRSSVSSDSSSIVAGGGGGSEMRFIDELLARSDSSLNTSSAGGDGAAPANSLSSEGREETDASSRSEAVQQQKIASTNMKLVESQKIISKNRSEMAEMKEANGKLQQDMSGLRLKCDELKRDRTDALNELKHARAKHDRDLSQMRNQLDNECASRFAAEKKLQELRQHLEDLEQVNASEWGKCERLETEKMALERETRKYKIQVDELESTLSRKNRQIKATFDSDMRSLQSEVHDKTQELLELKHVQGRMAKELDDSTEELEHIRKLAGQREQEIKSLRSRVEELKRELASVQDAFDRSSSSERRLQRTVEELEEQTDNLQVQLQHAQTRLKHQPGDKGSQFQ